MDKKTYLIKAIWEVAGTMEIKANSLEEAEELALGDFPLPLDSESDYIDGTLKLDKEHPDYGVAY